MVTLNWTKIRNEYINGNISYRKLAEKHNISFNTLKDRAVAEKWFEKRKEQHNKIATKTEQKTVEKIAEKNSDLDCEIYNAKVKLLGKIYEAIEQTDLFIERTKIKAPTRVRDKQGTVINAFMEKEEINLSSKSVKTANGENRAGINLDSLAKITGMIKDLQTMQSQGKNEATANEKPSINICVRAATPNDVANENDEEY